MSLYHADLLGSLTPGSAAWTAFVVCSMMRFLVPVDHLTWSLMTLMRWLMTTISTCSFGM